MPKPTAAEALAAKPSEVAAVKNRRANPAVADRAANQNTANPPRGLASRGAAIKASAGPSSGSNNAGSAHRPGTNS